MLVAENEPVSPVAEAYRSLRTAIRQKKEIQLKQSRQLTKGIVLMVASPKAQEGKSTTLANLAVTYVQDGKEVVAIDGNLRHPGLHEAFGLPNDTGLVQLLKTGASYQDVLLPSGMAHLDVIPTGGVPSNPSELLGSAEMAELLDELKRQFDVILLDSPAALEYTDAGLLAEYTDGVMMVVKRGKTKREHAKKTKELLERAGAHMLGLVLNK